ncbi:MAG: isochorismatase family protein [Acidimicrobiales bacterium]
MHTQPYAWPWDRTGDEPLAADRLAVVVCGGPPPGAARGDAAGIDDALADIAATVAALRELGATVVWVRCGSPTAPSRRPPGLLPTVGSDDWELLDGPEPGDVVIDTPGLDAFLVEWTDLELRGRGVDRLLLCGLGTEGPVSSTNRSANDRGYECLIALDAVVHHTAVTGAASLSSVCMSGGIFGAVGTAAELLAELSPNPTNP